MKRNYLQRSACAAGLMTLGIAASAHAADIDVVGTQTALNATYGLKTLTGDQTWTADNIYIMTDRVYVPAGVTLTIEPGTKIYSTFDDKGTSGDTDDDTVGALIVARGATINAQGTASKPITFDALQSLEAERGEDLPFDVDNIAGPMPTETTTALWGGVIILGNSSISLVDAAQQPVRNDVIEGFTPAGVTDADADGFSDILEYGYDAAFPLDAADNSGVFSYVSIRHGGYNFSEGNEINGLTLGGVGSGTKIDHVEVYANEDDGVEFFGGSVNTNHMVVAFCKDDSFDIDQGHSGTHQFWFAIQNPSGGDNLGEWDGVDTNVEDQSAKTAANVSASNPQIWNVTFVGPGATSFTNETVSKDNGLYLDDNFNGALRNSIIHDSVNFLATFSSDGSFATNGFANNTVGSFGRYSANNGSVINSQKAGFYHALNMPNNGNTAAQTSPAFAAYTRDGSGQLSLIDPRPTTLNTSVTTGAPTAAAYRGAFDKTNNWAAEWTKLGEVGAFGEVFVDVVGSQTAQNASYGLKTLSGNQTWTADKTYIMTDRVYVPAGVTLTIEPGTKIYSTFDNKGTSGDTDDDTVGALIVARGATINAQGTENAPIVFDALQTLEAELGTDLPFDVDNIAGPMPTETTTALWGGVVILGNSSISLVDAAQQPVRNDVIEGFTPAGVTDADADGFSDILEYGYDAAFPLDAADNSGVFSYVSIRHGGYNFSEGNEINGLTLGGVGSGTKIDHVEVYANEDDGVEFFGGSVNTNHMVVAFCKDDSFDIDQGHSGTHQFWFAIQNPSGGDNLGEWDGVDTNVEDQSAKTAANVSASNPQIWNVTFVGPGATSFTNETVSKDNGLYLDDNFNGALRNSIIHDSVNFLATFSSDGSFATNGFANNTVGSFGRYSANNGSVINSQKAGFYHALNMPNNGNTAAQTSPAFAAYTRDGSGQLAGIDPRPTSVNTVISSGAPVTASYRGAFGGSNSKNWTANWTKLAQTGAVLIDTDLDGTYDVDDTDDDNDGLSDAQELAAGTNPLVADPAALVAALNSGGGIADSDGDGISDALESTPALQALGFSSATNNVSPTNLFSNIYSASSIQDLSADDIVVQKSGNTVNLSIPVESSNNLVPPFTPAGNATLQLNGVPSDKQFYRFRIAQP